VQYVVDKVTFRGNNSLSDAQLRKNLKLIEGAPFESDMLQRDVRELVRAYSPLGFIYQTGSSDRDYLQIGTPNEPVKTIFRPEPGKVELVYEIKEGKPFKLGRVIVKGNGRTQDKVVLREMHMAPGQTYNSAEVQDAADRLRGSGYFAGAQITPTGEDPNVRDLLVEVQEAKTANFGVGAGINSNGGLGANVSYEQRNFDITNWPDSWSDVFSDRAFIGAGQRFRITLEPGTEQTNASILFSEPYIFDQPYSFTGELYYRDRLREDWRETRGGGRVSFGKRFDLVHSALLTFRGEDVNVHDIEDDDAIPPIRAPEILEREGHNTLTSLALQLRRDTTNRGPLLYRGTSSMLGWESYGVLGGDFTFQKLSAGWDMYVPVYEDLLDRRTVLALHADAGWIWGSAPFFERYYAGGIGTVRGFRFRGISPRDGLAEDPIGGDFSITGSAELSFPLYGESFRGVLFTDVGTVEREMQIGTIRSSAGFGFRMLTPMLGDIALDFALPLSKSGEDETEWLSFSFGIQR
jgi:outer membrane protein insertion porin family